MTQTYPTIRELLADPLLAGAEVVAGSAGLDRPVRDLALYPMQGPVAPSALIVAGAAAITPAYKLDALVRRAERVEAAAILVVATEGRPLLSAVRLAEKFAVPVVFLLRADLPPLALELAVLLRAPHIAQAETLIRLTAALAGREDLGDVIARASQAIGTPLSVLSADGRRLAGDEVDTRGVRFDILAPHQAETVDAQPVLRDRGNRVMAWIAAESAGIGAVRRETVRYALTVVEPYVRAWFVTESARSDRDGVYLAHLLTTVLMTEGEVDQETAERAAQAGWRLSDWHMAVHIVLDDPRAPSDREHVADRLRQEIAATGVDVAGVVDHSGGWALWTSWPGPPPADGSRDMLRAVRLALARLPREWGLVAGVGRAQLGPAGLAESLAEARNAGYLARSRAVRPAVDHADELGIAQLLATLQQSEVTRAFAESALAPISDAASDHLRATLAAFLQNGGSVVFTAQALNVHRNTVTARLQQIRERLGVDLDDSSVRLALQMAVRAMQG